MYFSAIPVTRRAWLLLALAAAPGASAELAGFDAVLARVPKEGAAAVKNVTAADFYRERDALLASLDKLAPEEAATRWLALAERCRAVSRDQWNRVYDRDYDDRSVGALIRALPDPRSWDAIIAGINGGEPVPQTGFDLSLRALAAALDGGAASRNALVATMKRYSETKFGTGRREERNRSKLNEFIVRLAGQDSPLALEVAKKEWESLRQGEPGPGGRRALGALPDLIALYGADDAAKQLKALLIEGAVFDPYGEGAENPVMAALVVRIALETVPEQKFPAWGAVALAETPALFEALSARFPTSEDDYESGFGEVAKHQVELLLRAGRTDDAVGLAASVWKKSKRLPNFRTRHGLPSNPAFADYYSKLLTLVPSVPVYEEYIRAMAAAGRSEDALKTLREIGKRPDFPASLRAQIDRSERRALLAAGRLDEVVPTLIARLAAGSPQERGDGFFGNDSEDESIAWNAILARATRRPDLVSAVLEATRREVALIIRSKRWENVSEITNHIQTLVDFDTPEAVEKTVSDILVAMGASAVTDPGAGRSASAALLPLVDVYGKAGRHADAVAVLEKSPCWEVSDLRNLSAYRTISPKFFSGVAGSLLALNRRPEAARVIAFTLARDPGDDDAYALALRLDGPGEAFLKRMDALFALDRFEERPLIWKAKCLYELGRYDEALVVAKNAVEIDPSDGEEGKGDRMRVYAVLADILEKKGDAETAKVYRGAVSAIRLSEDADDWYAAGVLSKAIAMYEEALTRFADAYCVQSRLALRYAEAGDMTNAAVHYTRAFELMPDSFGRIESHCFGCEHAFEGDVAGNIAEKVFTGIIAKKPGNPRAHYLLGYLRESQNRHAEAAVSYRKAVGLDPDYFNAWSKLLALGSTSGVLIPGEKSKCAAELVRLDPAGRRRSSRDADLRAIWKRSVEAGKSGDGVVFALPAASERLASLPARRPGARGRGDSDSDPRRELMRTDFVRSALDFANMEE